MQRTLTEQAKRLVSEALVTGKFGTDRNCVVVYFKIALTKDEKKYNKLVIFYKKSQSLGKHKGMLAGYLADAGITSCLSTYFSEDIQNVVGGGAERQKGYIVPGYLFLDNPRITSAVLTACKPSNQYPKVATGKYHVPSKKVGDWLNSYNTKDDAISSESSSPQSQEPEQYNIGVDFNSITNIIVFSREMQKLTVPIDCNKVAKLSESGSTTFRAWLSICRLWDRYDRVINNKKIDLSIPSTVSRPKSDNRTMMEQISKLEQQIYGAFKTWPDDYDELDQRLERVENKFPGQEEIDKLLLERQVDKQLKQEHPNGSASAFDRIETRRRIRSDKEIGRALNDEGSVAMREIKQSVFGSLQTLIKYINDSKSEGPEIATSYLQQHQSIFKALSDEVTKSALPTASKNAFSTFFKRLSEQKTVKGCIGVLSEKMKDQTIDNFMDNLKDSTGKSPIITLTNQLNQKVLPHDKVANETGLKSSSNTRQRLNDELKQAVRNRRNQSSS